MTITSDRMPEPVDQSGVDRQPGRIDVEWAERAYRHQAPAAARSTGVRAPRLLLVLGAVVLTLVVIGMVVGMTHRDPAPPGLVSRATPTHAGVTTGSPSAPSPTSGTAQLLAPLPSLPPTLSISTR